MTNKPSLPDKPDDSSFHSEYRKDKRRQADKNTLMNINDILNTHGQKRETIAVGDSVLIEGSDSENGTYVILAQVTAISEGEAILAQKHKYYASGNECPYSNEEFRCSVNALKLSIQERLKEQYNFWSWFVDRWKADEEKYGK